MLAAPFLANHPFYHRVRLLPLVLIASGLAKGSGHLFLAAASAVGFGFFEAHGFSRAIGRAK
jgi:hypothetical protein